MNKRLTLDDAFRAIGGVHVYYQPPPSVKMQYPAIRYERADIQHESADNIPYLSNVVYQVTVIDKNPDSGIVDAISKFPRCYFNRHYTADNLNHDVFTIYT